jgi:hypothetical protein
MIRRLAQCPYCHDCEIALDDHPQLVFNPQSERQAPCPHLAWVDGRYSQWEHTPHGADREIGSLEFRWDPAEPGAAGRTERLLPYLRELLRQGPGWAFAPAEPFAVQTVNAEEKGADAQGRTYPVWDVDGWAVFAANPAAFWAALPACQEGQRSGLELDEGG